MNIKRLLLLLVMVYAVHTQAQIGYQISLLNTATGEPRANETVNVTVTLTNSEGSIIYTGNQSATTNDFGVLSLTIGDADTFKEVDVTKMPFYVEVSANGVSIGKSQVLSVPVAEYAKRTGTLTKELLVGTWVKEHNYCYEGTDYYHVLEYVSESGPHYKSIEYKYIRYEEETYELTFNADGNCNESIQRKFWTVGHKNTDGEPDDRSWVETTNDNPALIYFIDGNQVHIIREASYAYVVTDKRNQYSTVYIDSKFYFDSIGMLGDGYFKQ